MSQKIYRYVYALKEDYAEAIKWIDQYIEMAPSPGEKRAGYSWKGFYDFWLGSYEKCLSDLQMAESLAEALGDTTAMSMLDYIKGLIYYERGELELSRKLSDAFFDAVSAADPANKTFHRALFDLNIITD